MAHGKKRYALCAMRSAPSLMEIALFLILHWYLSLFFQTLFHHRYAAHKMFTMSKFWEKVFFIFSWIFQGSSYLSPNTYGILHRMHHAYADTEKDPHSPSYSSNIFEMMWKTKIIYSNLFYGRVKAEDRFTKDLPEWWSFEKIADAWPIRVAWGTLYVLFYIHFITAYGITTYWWMFLLLPIHFVIGPLHGAVINWFAHVIGYRNFDLADTSRNILPFDFLMLGEGYHNNHHKHSGRANFGVRWFEFDPVYMFIKLFNFLGIVRLRIADVAVKGHALALQNRRISLPAIVLGNGTPLSEIIACNLEAFTQAQRKLHRKLSEKVLTAFQEVKELGNGYAFRFPDDALLLQKINEWITLERLCCPFLNFKLEPLVLQSGLSNTNNSVWLHLTGGEGVKQFLRSYTQSA